MIHFTQLSEKLVTLHNEQEFEKFKQAFLQLRQVAMRMAAVIPSKYPAELPNLSTYNGKPKLRISRESDFILILAAFSEYTRRLETLKKGWTTSLRDVTTILERLS
jgi:hypothetical protein